MRGVAVLAVSLLSFAFARVSFPNSVVLQAPDLVATNKTDFQCLTPCRVYVDRKSDKLMITQNGNILANFDTIVSGSSVAPKGFDLPTGDYVLENRGEVNPQFVVYIVGSKSPNFGAAVYTPQANGVAVKDNARFVTILSSFEAIWFSSFTGTYPAGYPRIFAAGFDALSDGQCHPVYQARSQLNAELSWPTIPTAVLTIDFGFEGAHNVSVNQHEAHGPPKGGVESTVYTSPGYVGCSFNTGQNYYSTLSSVDDKFTLAADSLDINAVYNGITAIEPVQLTVNKKNVNMVGSDSYTDHFDKGEFDVQLSWLRATPGSNFALQLDFGSANDAPVQATTTIDSSISTTTTIDLSMSTTSIGMTLSTLPTVALVFAACLSA